MPKLLRIELTRDQTQELTYARDHHPLAYVRERAAAILKIASGMSGRRVALQGLLKPRNTDTVYAWVHRYQAEGLSGLMVKSGRGRKPAFSPSVSDLRAGDRPPPASGTARSTSVRT
jgi:hypothetical protein